MGETFPKQEKMREERRKYARVATNLYINYSIPGSETRETGVFVTKNISGGGILFESLCEIPVGTVFDLSIHLPTTPFPLPAKGRVVRIQKTRSYGRYDVGIALIGISGSDRRQLVRYLVSTVFTKNDCETLFGEEGNWKEIFFESSALGTTDQASP